MNNIFDIYQTAYNISINNETILPRNISSYDIGIISFISFICLLISICIIKIFLRQCEKCRAKIDNTESISEISEDKTNISETPSQSSAIQ